MSICCKTSLFFDAFRLTVVDLLNFLGKVRKTSSDINKFYKYCSQSAAH